MHAFICQWYTYILTIREKVGIRPIYFSFLQFEPLTTCSSIFEQIDECLS